MSSGGATVAAVRSEGLATSTAMVLLPTGELREYPRPATAAQALQDSVEAGDGSAGWFLCDADAMGFEGPVAAVGGGEELRPGQIYFVLPAEVKRNGLRREDVAALAVRTSAGSVSPLVFAPPPEVDETLAYKTVPALVVKRRPVARVKSAGRMQPRFAPDLTAIPECE